MESLGAVYARILKNRQRRIDYEPNDSASVAIACNLCNGTGWLIQKLERTDPRFGQAFPCQCRREAMVEALLRTAKLPTQHGIHTLGSYNPVEGCQDTLRSIEDMASGDFNWNILTLVGHPGLGKTHLLEMLGRAVVDKGISVRYHCTPDWIDSLRAGNNPEAEVSYETLWARTTNAELVLLDDVKEYHVTPFAVEQVGRLVDERYRNGGLLVVTTNLSFTEMADIWDWRIADRLFEGDSNTVRVSRLTGPSYRTGEDWNARS